MCCVPAYPVRTHGSVTKKATRPAMYLLHFSRYDCPGCDKMWWFTTMGDLESFIKAAYPKYPVAEWPPDRGFYPNGLSIRKCTGNNQDLILRSMVDVHDFEYDMPECLSPEVETVAKLIYDLQGIVDLIEDGEYAWPA